MILTVASWAMKTMTKWYERVVAGEVVARGTLSVSGGPFAGSAAAIQLVPDSPFSDRRELDQPVARPAPAPAEVVAHPMRQLGKDEKYRDTAWVPRLLWALEWARKNRFGGQAEPMSAADCARVLREQGGLDVPGTNVARAFRNFGRDERAIGLWVASDRGFEITPAGIEVITSMLSS